MTEHDQLLPEDILSMHFEVTMDNIHDLQLLEESARNSNDSISMLHTRRRLLEEMDTAYQLAEELGLERTAVDGALL